MAAWLNKVADALTGNAADGEPSVRRLLDRVRRARSRLELDHVHARDEPHAVMITTIEQLGDDDLVIAPPSIGAQARPLTTGERLRLAFQGPNGRLAGETRVLGRIKLLSGGGDVFYGYRLEIPPSLEANERRVGRRVPVGIDLAPRAELFRPEAGSELPLRGVVQDISSTGLLIRCPNARGKVSLDDRLFLKVTLPPPVGALDEMVRIARLESGATRDEHLVGVRLERRLDRLAALVQQLESLRRKRLRA
jgi:hypothetical protein